MSTALRVSRLAARIKTATEASDAMVEASDAMVEAMRALFKAMRALFKARVTRCSRSCRGWFVDVDVGPTRCDECAITNGYDHIVADRDVALLPEADIAWRKIQEQS